MSKSSPPGGSLAQSRRNKAEETTATAKALIEAERDAARRKTEKLQALRLAREAEEAQAADVPAPKKKPRRS